MSKPFFPNVEKIEYEGPDSDNPLAFRFYQPDKVVMGKSMEEQLRMAVCYWHTFAWPGVDVFGAGTFDRPWQGADDKEHAEVKLAAAFEFFEKLGLPYYCFHDVDAVPLGEDLNTAASNLNWMADLMAKQMERSGIKLLWGTANLFSHPRYMGGAATNPDPEVFAYGAGQVRNMMDVTKRLAGENYVLWGGREGYETLLNTDMARELDQMARFVSMVVEYKHKIGFDGLILIEPKPCEPTKHQYDHDVATVYGFLKKYGLENEVKVNVEVNHATLAGHSFEHEIATAAVLGILGSVDINRGDAQNGWDTDQFHNNVPELSLALYHILKAGGLEQGGFNFDAKVLRQSVDATDLFHAHIGGVDVLARSLLAAETMINDGVLDGFVADRYAGWDGAFGKSILSGDQGLAELADTARDRGLAPTPKSGQQEYLENVVNRYV